MKKSVSLVALIVICACCLFFSGTTFTDLINWHRFNKSVEAEAAITELRKETVIGGPNFAKHRIRVSYQYSYEGENYTSNRVSIHGRKGTFGFNDKMYNSLKEAQDENNTVTCYLLKNAPSSAVLDRELDRKMIAFFTSMSLAWSGAAVIMGKVVKYEFENLYGDD